MKTAPENPTVQDQLTASGALPQLDKALAANAATIEMRLAATEETIVIPRRALQLLRRALVRMAAGQAVALATADAEGAAEVSTQQAADRLHVSRPHVVKLLTEGALPFRMVGRHRRILLPDLLRYEAAQAARREAQLRFLAGQAQDLQMGYE